MHPVEQVLEQDIEPLVDRVQSFSELGHVPS
jgi:hypothetical protein